VGHESRRAPSILHASARECAHTGSGSNNIGDEGAKAIADAVAASGSLATLYLKGNKIGDEGAKALAAGVAASGSLALKYLSVDDELLEHAELAAACRAKGVRLH